MSQSKFICIGTIGKPRGLKGEFFLNSFCNPTENILSYQSLITIENHKDYKIEYIKKSHNKFVSKIINFSCFFSRFLTPCFFTTLSKEQLVIIKNVNK